QETGGRAFFPARIEDLNGVYTQIADELASQYALGYVSANQRRDGAWRRLVVQTSRPNITPRTQKGYYAPTARCTRSLSCSPQPSRLSTRCISPDDSQPSVAWRRRCCSSLCSRTRSSSGCRR